MRADIYLRTGGGAATVRNAACSLLLATGVAIAPTLGPLDQLEAEATRDEPCPPSRRLKENFLIIRWSLGVGRQPTFRGDGHSCYLSLFSFDCTPHHLEAAVASFSLRLFHTK